MCYSPWGCKELDMSEWLISNNNMCLSIWWGGRKEKGVDRYLAHPLNAWPCQITILMPRGGNGLNQSSLPRSEVHYGKIRGFTPHPHEALCAFGAQASWMKSWRGSLLWRAPWPCLWIPHWPCGYKPQFTRKELCSERGTRSPRGPALVGLGHRVAQAPGQPADPLLSPSSQLCQAGRSALRCHADWTKSLWPDPTLYAAWVSHFFSMPVSVLLYKIIVLHSEDGLENKARGPVPYVSHTDDRRWELATFQAPL